MPDASRDTSCSDFLRCYANEDGKSRGYQILPDVCHDPRGVEPKLIFASSRRVWLDVFLLGLVVAVALAVSLAMVDRTLVGVLLGLLFLAFAMVLGRMGLQALGLARDPLPVMMLDTDGLECAYGRVDWASIESVATGESEGEPYILFALQSDAVWQPVVARYTSYPVSIYNGEFRVEARVVESLSIEDAERYRQLPV